MRVFRLLFVVALTSGSSAMAEAVPASLQVVDSAGRVLGPVVDADGSLFPEIPAVTLTVDGHAVLASVRKSGGIFVPASNGTVDAGSVWFSGADCTGQAYMRLWVANAMWEPQAIVGPANSVFLGSSSAAPQLVTYGSVLRAETACVNEVGQLGLVPATFLQDLTPPYQPPFRLEPVVVSSGQVPAVSGIGLAVLASSLAALALFVLRRKA